MSCATLKTRSSVFADCMVFPFSLVVRRRWFGSGTSSRVTSAGPIGQNVGNILPRRLCSHAWIGPITPVEEKIGASSLADFAGIGVGADFSIDRIRSRLPPCAKISAKRLQIDD